MTHPRFFYIFTGVDSLAGLIRRFLHPDQHWWATKELAALLTRNHALTWEMAKRELTERYAGSAFGIFWTFAQPILVMGIQIFVFTFIFAVRVGGTEDMPRDYVVYMLSGLLPWFYMSDSISRGCNSITGNASLVKQVIFPIEVLPVKTALAALVSQMLATGALVVYSALKFKSLPWTIALLPIAAVTQVLFMIGLNYLLSSISVFFRDTRDIVQLFLMVGLYIQPILFIPDMVPVFFRPVLALNPFSHITWIYQDIFFFGRLDHPVSWALVPCMSFFTFYAGYRVFRKLKTMFGNAL